MICVQQSAGDYLGYQKWKIRIMKALPIEAKSKHIGSSSYGVKVRKFMSQGRCQTQIQHQLLHFYPRTMDSIYFKNFCAQSNTVILQNSHYLFLRFVFRHVLFYLVLLFAACVTFRHRQRKLFKQSMIEFISFSDFVLN